MAEASCEPLAVEIAGHPRRYGWAHAGLGVKDGLRALAGLGLPMGVVSNSNGTVEGDLRSVGVCYVPDGDGPPRPEGRADGRHPGLRGGRRGQAGPGIFRIALDALNVPADGSVLHVGDSLRYDVAGALAAGLQPVHMDPYGLCPAPDGHPHIGSLAELAQALTSTRRRLLQPPQAPAGARLRASCAGPRCTSPRCARTRRTPARPATGCCCARAISAS